MKVLQTVKFYEPSKGGMESVVKNIVEGVISLSDNHLFTVYANSHFSNIKREYLDIKQLKSIKERTPFLLRSQPLSIRYSQLRKLLTETDILHHHYPFPNMELALLRNLDILKNKKLIITWHANIKNSRWSWIGKYYNPIIRKLLDLADCIIVTSPQLLSSSDILQDYVEKVKVIPLSYNANIIKGAGRARKFPENRPFRLLFVGKLRSYKGLGFLINAIKDVNVNLKIIGDGEEEQNLKILVKELGIEKRVAFLKGLNNDELALNYQESDLFILPSINEAEAFGVVQLEGMSNGLPVINTNLDSGVPFVSLQGITGLTVEPKSIGELKSAILEIINNKVLYEEFSQNCIQRAKEFTTEKMASSYLNLYNSLQ
ncbi:glycosyltransferase [Pedobacter nototheniae]|uniref:glycosyltransferase n=1 Tax=Pedobacter nototheniae TaxID=2488994 RepID=UPI001039696A|nr:glycosyltransferase [Pedobacter nototheniae]